MSKYTIKNATAEYTGGGIYIYYGELENGLYFRTSDDAWHIAICDADTSTDEADYDEFYHEHEVDGLQDYDYENFFNDMILWIMHNAPKGNYNIDELENRMYNRIETKIEIENAQTLVKTIQAEVKQAKFDSMMVYQVESIKSFMSEYQDGCSFIFSRSDQYNRDFEKQWKDEFYTNARRIFENKGYKIELRSTHEYIVW